MFAPRKGFGESLSLHWLVFKRLPLKIICQSHVFAVSCPELDSHCCPLVYRIDAEHSLYDRSVSNLRLLGIIKQLLSPFVCVCLFPVPVVGSSGPLLYQPPSYPHAAL